MDIEALTNIILNEKRTDDEIRKTLTDAKILDEQGNYVEYHFPVTLGRDSKPK